MPSKTTDELLARKAGSSEESPVDYPGGVYVLTRDDGSTSEIVVQYHPKFGTPGADAAVRLGYVYAREATAEDLAKHDPYTQAAVAETERSADTVSRSEFIKIQEQLAALLAEKTDRPEEAKLVSQSPVGAVEDVTKDVKNMNLDELQAHARELGVEHTPDATKAEIRQAIEDKNKQK